MVEMGGNGVEMSLAWKVLSATVSSDKERVYLRLLGWAEVWLAMTAKGPLSSGFS